MTRHLIKGSRADHSFPQPIGMSASFDRELIRECGRAVGEEARALYTRNGVEAGLCRWAPTIDMERDPRWGRTEESRRRSVSDRRWRAHISAV